MEKKHFILSLLMVVSHGSFIFPITPEVAVGKTLRDGIIAGTIGGALGYLIRDPWVKAEKNILIGSLILGIPTLLLSAAMHHNQTPSARLSRAQEKIKFLETRAVIDIVLHSISDKGAMIKSLIESCSTTPYPVIQALVQLENYLIALQEIINSLREAKNDQSDKEFLDQCDTIIERALPLCTPINEAIVYIKSLPNYPEQRRTYERMMADIRNEQMMWALLLQPRYVIFV